MKKCFVIYDLRRHNNFWGFDFGQNLRISDWTYPRNLALAKLYLKKIMIIFCLFLSYYFLQCPTVSESEAVRGISSAVLHRKLGVFHPLLLEQYTELTEQHLLVGGFTVHISSISLENTNRVPAGHPRLTPIKQLNHPNHLLHSVWSS